MMRNPGKFSIEDQMILSSVFLRDDVNLRSFVETEPFNWSYVLEACLRHRIASIVYARMQDSGCLKVIPEPIVRTFRKNYIANRIHNQYLYNQLKETSVYLAEQGISFMLIKGAALATLVYEDNGQRPMSDIDIMIREKDRRWYSVIREGLEKRGIEFRLFFELEVNHHDLTMNGMIPIDIESIWSRCRSIRIKEMDVLVMSPEDQILTLVIACCRKGFNHLRFYCDFSRIYYYFGHKIDWEVVVNKARASSLEFALYTFLRIVKVLSPDIIPEYVLNDLKLSGTRRRVVEFLINRQILFRSRPGKIIGCPRPIYRHLLKFAVSNYKIVFKRLNRFLRSSYPIGKRVLS